MRNQGPPAPGGPSIFLMLFFNNLLSLVIEGYYGSPDAGGNKEGKLWEMLGFRPGSVSGGQESAPETDLPHKTFDQLRDRYDVIIVGAGAGGSVAAEVLAKPASKC